MSIQKNHTQIVSNDVVVANESSIPTCVPITQNGVTYTCGEAMKKLATDTHYEVCTNLVTQPTPNDCPDAAHSLNPKTGYCEIPPTPTCPDGVPLVEGDDPWSIEDDKCLLEVPADHTCSSESETYNEDTGLCEGTSIGMPVCESGLAPVNGVCKSVKAGCYWDKNSYILKKDYPQFIWGGIVDV